MVARRAGAPVALPALRAAARVRLRRALRTAPPEAAPLLRSLDRHLAGRHTTAERATFRRIEALRTTLLSSDRQLRVVNYGAGRPGSVKTEAQMRRGRRRTTTVGAVARQAAKPPWWAQQLAVLVADLRPTHVVELGTSLGLSAAYQASALEPGARMWTLEGAPEIADAARGHLDLLGLDRVTVVTGRFEETLSDVLADAAPVDLAFIDGHHDEAATLRYFDQIHPFLAPDALVVFDDIAWSEGMTRAWRAIAADQRIRTAVSMRSVGVCLVGPPSVAKLRLDLHLR